MPDTTAQLHKQMPSKGTTVNPLDYDELDFESRDEIDTADHAAALALLDEETF